MTESAPLYAYHDAQQGSAHSYLLGPVLREIARLAPKTLFELGTGNGFVAHQIAQTGVRVIGIEASESGVAIANQAFPSLQIELGSAYEDLSARFGQFPVVLSLEVVEHVMQPRVYAKTIADLLRPGGTAIISTPYHGYWKNLALAITGKMDAHFTALWDGGHIKFWSIKTLSELLAEVGLQVERVDRVGRIPALAKSMIVLARKPQ